MTRPRPDRRGDDARADRVGAQGRADRLLLEVVQLRRQRARAQLQRQVRDFFGREAAGDAPFRVDLALERRRRLHAAVEDDRQLAADVLAADLAELPAALVAEREADRRPVVLVDRGARVAQVLAGDGRDLLHHVVDRAGVARPGAAGARHDVHALRHLAVDHQRFLRRRRRAFDDLQLEEAGRSDDALRALDVGDAGQLDEDLVVALLRDARLGDAELVDAALDRLARLDDRLLAQVDLDVRLHRERVAAVHAAAAVEVRLHLVGGRPERRVLRRRHAVDLEMDRIGRVHVRDRDVARLQLFAQPLHLLLGHQPQRIVGLDAEHEVDAALQIESELELLVHQPARRRQMVARGQDRIDPEPEEHDEDGENGDDLPAKVGHMFLYGFVGVWTTGGCP